MAKAEYFSEEFVSKLPDDVHEGLLELCSEFHRYYDRQGEIDKPLCTEPSLLTICALFEAYAEIKDYALMHLPLLNGSKEDLVRVYKFISDIESNAKPIALQANREKDKQHFKILLLKEHPYIFSDQEFSTIQKIINELRDLIKKSSLIPDDHKRRLLLRLEAMQGELHKKSRDIDRFWGFIAEAGIVARKFGEDLKPITERVDTLGRIVIGVVMAKEGIKALPDLVKLLH